MRHVSLGLLAALAGGSAFALGNDDPLRKIGHVVVIYEENRSFDNLLGLFPGADGVAQASDVAKTQVDAEGKPYATLPPIMDTNMRPPVVDMRFPAGLPNAPFATDPYVPQTINTGDLIHRFYVEQYQIDGGRMDRFALASDAKGLVMSYYDLARAASKDGAPPTALWDYAKEFALNDAFFHAAFGGSFLNHTFLACACAYVWPKPAPANVTVMGDGNAFWPLKVDGRTTPLMANGNAYVINTSRSVYLHAPTDKPEVLVPPQFMTHIGDRMDEAGVSWVWYGGGYRDALAGMLNPAGKVHADPMFQYHHQPFAFFADLAPGTPGNAAHMKDLPDLLADIRAGTLPQVTFYKPIGELNLHPGYTNITDGDTHLRELVTALQDSPQYQDMLILVTFDEHGGLWDHVAPPKRDQWGPGTRVPLVAIGPTVKRGFIDHAPADTLAILRLIEDRFNVRRMHPDNTGVEAVYANDGTGIADETKAGDLRSLLR